MAANTTLLNETAKEADRVGRVFIALAQGMRKCLVCDELFTRQAAAEHVLCWPRKRKTLAKACQAK